MPLVRVKLMAGQRILAAPARPYASTKTVKEVLDQVLESHGGALTLRSALDVYPTAEENKSQRTELEKSDRRSGVDAIVPEDGAALSS
ncbi:hypothetical protein AB1Y20_009506 [Prymnesium parvum]|uniref:Uncharacterized protein n=1 Tax=Prymnesium parvum TaxID=97485 RepID=A0AB34K6P7_PRYPA